MRFLVVLCLLVLVMSVTISHAFATPGHGCAPLVPPAVPGSLVQPPPVQGLLSINEVLLTSRSLWGCPDAGTPPPNTDTWVEIYNPQAQPFDLYSAHTSLDSGPNSQPFYFPFGAAIAPHTFLVVFPPISLLFSSSQTPTLRLLIAGVTIDQIIVPSLGEDQSYARVPDGSNSWQITSQPSIDASNNPVPNVSTPTPPSHHKTTQQPTKTSTKGKTSKNTTGTASDGTNQPTVVNGAQPTWAALQLPSPTATPLIQPIPLASTVVAPPDKDSGDVPQKILLTTGAVVLPLLLLFCRRLFTKRKKETST